MLGWERGGAGDVKNADKCFDSGFLMMSTDVLHALYIVLLIS